MALPLTAPRASGDAAAALRRDAHPLTGAADDYDALLERIGDARVVLLGEASHGTHEFYRERARITRRLIRERGVTAVAVEGDWPDAHRVNRYVRGDGRVAGAEEALRGFRRFPTWMWRNADVLDFVGWLREHNAGLDDPLRAVGFYGLDLYSLGESIEAVVRYLDVHDPEAARRARRRYECLQPYSGESTEYGRAVLLGVSASCRRDVLAELVALRRRAGEYLMADGAVAEDEYFFAEQNAVVVADAEEYYRTMFGDAVSSWNLRDRHMADTLDHLIAHMDRHDGTGRVVVWEHNSHVGDARATEMGRRGELTVGQLMRERHPGEVVSVGFTTHEGTVTAADGWGEPARRMRVLPSLEGSHEELLHRTGLPAFLLLPEPGTAAAELLHEPRLERAIGVIYRPRTERQSHWFAADLAAQFDAVVHIDATRAVEPLERGQRWALSEPPETYPSAL